MLARQIKSTLVSANVPVEDSIGNFISSPKPNVGVVITGPDDKLVEALMAALKPFSATEGSFDPAKAQNAAPAEIFVGVKPLSQ
jgi:hypothetical protein